MLIRGIRPHPAKTRLRHVRVCKWLVGCSAWNDPSGCGTQLIARGVLEPDDVARAIVMAVTARRNRALAASR